MGKHSILSVDAHYQDRRAIIAGVLFDDWFDEVEKAAYTSILWEVKGYEPGAFYRREMPCLLKLINEHRLNPQTIVIDGLVYLDGARKPGLGKHLYDALAGRASVIGVAKNAYKGLPKQYEVYRGRSKKPLWVTSVGVDLDRARQYIKSMHGPYRIPTLLKQVDQISRQL